MTTEKKIILIVEDDRFLVEACKFIFEQGGFEVWTAQDGEVAVKLLEGPPPHVVLLDIMLPGINGFDVLAKIGQTPAWHMVPVIILSNLGQAENVQRGTELGAVDYLIKANTDISEVIKKVRLLLK